MSLQLFFVDKFLRFRMKRVFAKRPDPLLLRSMMNMKIAQSKRPPPRVKVTTTTLGGIPTEVLTPDGARDDAAILYVHGGGWVAGSPSSHRALTWRLADRAKMRVFVVDYRLAPEHPFPGGLEDILAAYDALVDVEKIAPSKIAVGGDSAGGNLTLALALKLKAIGRPLPGALVCLSPSTSFEELPSHKSNLESDAMFHPALFDTVIKAYCGEANKHDPFVSPLLGDVAGLPPTLFHCSTLELLHDDSERMAKKINDAGGDATFEATPEVFHAWHILADVLPESRSAIDRIARYVVDRLA